MQQASPFVLRASYPVRESRPVCVQKCLSRAAHSPSFRKRSPRLLSIHHDSMADRLSRRKWSRNGGQIALLCSGCIGYSENGHLLGVLQPSLLLSPGHVNLTGNANRTCDSHCATPNEPRLMIRATHRPQAPHAPHALSDEH